MKKRPSSKSMEKYVRSTIIGVLGDLLQNPIDILNTNPSFLELGINSVLSVELVEALNHIIQIKMEVEVIFDFEGIDELVLVTSLSRVNV